MTHDLPDSYRQLAARLDAIPNGFPATASGVELRLLAAMYTPEEAALAACMKLKNETPAEIAARAGLAPDEARQMLKAMARQGLIAAGRGEGGVAYRLMPFVVGVYEAQLPRLGAELAALFEQYFQESRGLAVDGPAIHRVIPINESIPSGVEVFPHEHATTLIENAKAWAVQDCICRVQKKLIGEGCGHPVENCLVFAPVPGVFDHSQTMRAIDKDEALRILQEAADAGLVHSTGNFQNGNDYICNCCTCSCGVLRGIAEFSQPTAAHSSFRAVVDDWECLGCGDCLARCQFGALSVPGDVCQVDHTRCVGCGLCTTVCPSGALTMEMRPEADRPHTPVDNRAWMQQRAERRGIDFDALL